MPLLLGGGAAVQVQPVNATLEFKVVLLLFEGWVFAIAIVEKIEFGVGVACLAFWCGGLLLLGPRAATDRATTSCIALFVAMQIQSVNSTLANVEFSVVLLELRQILLRPRRLGRVEGGRELPTRRTATDRATTSRIALFVTMQVQAMNSTLANVEFQLVLLLLLRLLLLLLAPTTTKLVYVRWAPPFPFPFPAPTLTISPFIVIFAAASVEILNLLNQLQI